MSNTTSEKDLQLLLEAMDNLGHGSFRDIDRNNFSNPELADAFNDMLAGLMGRNNHYLARINDAMTRIADLSELKNIFEQITSQQSVVSSLNSSKDYFGNSYNELWKNSNELLALSKQIRNAYSPFINELEENANSFDRSIQQFTEFIEATEEFHDTVINNTTSCEPIEASKKEILDEVTKFSRVYDRIIADLQNCKSLIVRTKDTLESNNSRLVSISMDVKNAYNHVKEQSETTSSILKDTNEIIESYNNVTINGFQLGRHLFRISRDIDNCRNDLFRQNSRPTLHDTLRIFEVDHLTLSWRVYNHLQDFETLKITQLNNPKGCKLGLWIEQQTDPQLCDTNEFSNMRTLHNKLHQHAINVFEAKAAYNMPLAYQEFTLLLNTMEELSTAMHEFHQYLHSIGISDETEIWHFKE